MLRVAILLLAAPALVQPHPPDEDAPGDATRAKRLRDDIGALMSQPFEAILRTQRLVELGFDRWSTTSSCTNPPRAGVDEQTVAMREHVYAEVLHSGVGGSWTAEASEWRWADGKTMMYIGTEAGRFVGYRAPEGEKAHVSTH